jgi:hypothetical protein
MEQGFERIGAIKQAPQGTLTAAREPTQGPGEQGKKPEYENKGQDRVHERTGPRMLPAVCPTRSAWGK